MRFQVTLDRDESGAWVVECPAIPGCVSQGETRAEALSNIQEAIALCLEVRAVFSPAPSPSPAPPASAPAGF
jgi:predicted RNase H-like HicB family nuclease